jgi:hypothetical protein
MIDAASHVKAPPGFGVEARLVSQFRKMMSEDAYEDACRFAMRLSDLLLASDCNRSRLWLFKTLFKPLAARYLAQYQSYDFEIVDYAMFLLSRDFVMFRGPRPSQGQLERGQYVTFLGAAQLFGRYHRRPVHILLQEETGLATVNLAMGGAGPAFFHNPQLLDIANGGKFVVLQVMSARSIGCENYPGLRMTRRAGTNEPLRDRLDILTEIYRANPREACRVAEKWRRNYIAAYQQLIARLRRPVMLIWMSDRRPDEWHPEDLAERGEFGTFPQLVDEGLLSELALLCTRYVELDPDQSMSYRFRSRISGLECPCVGPAGALSWSSSYYSSEQPHQELARIILKSGGVFSL